MLGNILLLSLLATLEGILVHKHSNFSQMKILTQWFNINAGKRECPCFHQGNHLNILDETSLEKIEGATGIYN